MDIRSVEDSHLIPLYQKRDIIFSRGEGPYVYDLDGKKYLDFITNIGPTLLGYGNKKITNALVRQLETLHNCHSSFYNETRARFLEKLHSVLPNELSRSFFAVTGTEAVEAALKFARKHTGKPGVISANRSFHGRTMGALSAMGNDKYRGPFEPLLSSFVQVPFNDVHAIEEAITENIGAVILEPIQGEAGIRVPDDDYIARVRELCTEKGVLLIADEIQTGLRVGDWTRMQQLGVVPDILTLSKGIANGIPFSITVTTEEVSDSMSKGDHGSTFGGNPISLAAGLATFEEIEDRDLLKKSGEMGELLMKRLREELGGLPIVRDIRGIGMMIGVELKTRSGLPAKHMQEKGLIVSPTGGTVIRLLPPLTIEESHIKEAVKIMKEVISEL